MKWYEDDDLIKSYIVNGVDKSVVDKIKVMYDKGVPIDTIRKSLDDSEKHVFEMFLKGAFGKVNEDLHIRKAYQSFGVRYDAIDKN